MSFGDGIDRKFCYSLTDLHEFDYCPFRFFVKHHLGKKYEIEEGNGQLALGVILDQSIKLFHESKAYGQPKEYLANIVRRAVFVIKEDAKRKPSPSFYSAVLPFLSEELIEKAIKIFQSYYEGISGKVLKSLGKVGFCEWVLEGKDQQFKLWGGPDAFEMGEDGIPEIVDYKSRSNEDVQKGRDNIDMELMPKLYTLLCAKKLLGMGYKKAKFIVRIWQSPNDNSLYEEFDLEAIDSLEPIFLQKIVKIEETKELEFCQKKFCRACNHKDREKFVLELERLGLVPAEDIPLQNLQAQNLS